MRERPLEKVFWTTQQTFNGVFFTLVPWLVFSFAISALNASTPAPTKLTIQQDLVAAIFAFLFTLVGEGVFLLAPLYFVRRTTSPSPTRWKSLLDVLGFRRFDFWRTLPCLLVFFVAIIGLNYGYSVLITTFHLHLQVNSDSVLQSGKLAPLSMYATLLGAVFVAPICEEIFFRSFTFMGLRNGMPLIAAIIFSALIFAAAHGQPGSFPILLCIGLLLALLRWRTQSIWPGIILHILNNGTSALLIILTLYGIPTPF